MFERILELVDAVPDFERFAGVDELVAGMGDLARQRPDLAAVDRIGSSRREEPLWSLTVRGGPRHRPDPACRWRVELRLRIPHGTAYLATEVPYWANADADDHAVLEVSYADLLRWRAERTQHTESVLTAAFEAVRPHLLAGSPQLRATECFLPFLRVSAEADLVRAAEAGSERPAVVAERFLVTATTHSTRVRFAGMLLSAMEAELASGADEPVLRSEHARLVEVFDRWAAEADAEVPPRTIPVRKLVGVQFGAMPATAAELVAEA